MLTRSNLQIVEAPAFFRREQEIFTSGTESEAHSLHQAVPYPSKVHPDFISYFLSKYSKKDDVVLDPFCGGGTILLEAALAGRIPYGSDLSDLMLRVTRSKLEPADITEVTLALQQLSGSRPIDVSLYSKYFDCFFDLKTFQEICRFRESLLKANDRISRFISAVMMGILHGNSAGFLSTYSNPQFSLSPDQQREQNYKRRQNPDYRPVSPRILRKSAMLLRDGIPSVLHRVGAKKKIFQADARDLSYLKTNESALILTCPPMPGEVLKFEKQWLRNWFIGITEDKVFESSFSDLEKWHDFINATMVEMARVTKFGARCVLIVPENFAINSEVKPEESILSIVNNDLSLFWQAEGVVSNARRANAVAENYRSSSTRAQEERSIAVVLRRK